MNNVERLSHSQPRILVLGAHPDDAEVFAGGLIVRHCQAGAKVRIVSVTDGRSGHHSIAPADLVDIRRKEAASAGERIGAEYLTWDFPDGSLEPTLAVRSRLIREIREFGPDLVLTHRPNDYHPDHRAVGTAVQDASYMVTVPHVCPDVVALRQDPVVAYMCDLFSRPAPMRADVLLDVSEEFDMFVQMAACHVSQFFEWLPYHDGILDTVPSTAHERHVWLCARLAEFHRARCTTFQDEIVARGVPLDLDLRLEVFEISEYAGSADAAAILRLFPGAL